MASTGTSEEYSMAILYLRFKELSKFLIQEESDQKEKAKNPHPYIPPFNAAVVALANTLLAESAEEEPKHKRIALTNHVVEITEKTDVMGNVREEDPFDYNFSSAFSRQQLAPILQPRQDSDVSFRNFPYSDEDTKLLSSSLEKLAIMDNPNVETALIEVPRHTISLFLPHRIVFDDPFDSFVYVFSKKEFEDFKTRVESRVVAQHEKGPIGIGKSLLAYTYGSSFILIQYSIFYF